MFKYKVLSYILETKVILKQIFLSYLVQKYSYNKLLSYFTVKTSIKIETETAPVAAINKVITLPIIVLGKKSPSKYIFTYFITITNCSHCAQN